MAVTEDIKELKERTGANSSAVAELKGSFDSFKQIFSVVSLVLTLLGSFGAYDYLKSRTELQQSIRDAQKAEENARKAQKIADKITRAYSLVTQSSIVDSIEAEFNNQESLDSLRSKPEVVNKLKAYNKQLTEVLSDLDETERTSYQFVVEALEPYLKKDYKGALELLDKVKEKDRYRFTYAYMRGACLLRTEKLKEADDWFATASTLTGGRRQSLSMNAQGFSKLYQWKSSKKIEPLKEAIDIFEGITKADAQFAPAYFNLACAYAQSGEFAKVTYNLMLPVKKSYRPLKDVVARMEDDLSKSTERFLVEYVQNNLHVTIPYNHPNWKDDVEKALQLGSR